MDRVAEWIGTDIPKNLYLSGQLTDFQTRGQSKHLLGALQARYILTSS